MAGLVLTGGASRRMGFDKAAMIIEGEPLIDRVVRALSQVASPIFEVGPGYSGLTAVREEPTGAGPLAAVGAGWHALCEVGHPRAVIVLACDLPFIDATVLGLLAEWPSEQSVVPVVDGHPQPLCARWSSYDLDAALELIGVGEHAMRALWSRPGVQLLHQSEWRGAVSPRAYADVDAITDVERLGLRWSPGS